MATYLITGGKQLKGSVTLSGNKNSILPCMAACLLTEEQVTLTNVPDIRDVKVLSEMMEQLGSQVSFYDHQLQITTPEIMSSTLQQELSTKLRGSVLLAGALLGREGKARFYHPGGDVIGKRSIDTHLQGFKALGFEYESIDRNLGYQLTRSTTPEQVDFFLDEASVTATENLVLASVIGYSKVTLKNCAEEPHVVDLCELLVQMGASIEGIGTSTLKISGVEKLHGTQFTISSEHIEFGTYAVAAAITKGEIEIKAQKLPEMSPIILPLQQMGIEFLYTPDSVIVSAKNLQAIPKLHVNIWPGFPTDLMSVIIVLATQSQGVSLLHDWMYESRMFFVDKLINMGAHITIADPHRVVVYGPTKFYGRKLDSPDIRAGMALVLAALVADGESSIDHAELVERGYDDVVGKLQSLGADIKRVDFVEERRKSAS